MEIVLNNSHPAVKYLSQKDKHLAKVMQMVGEIRYTPHSDGYSFLIHEIIEQMLSIKAGATIYKRLEDLCHGSITPSSIAELSADDIRSTGTSAAKTNYIQGITDAVLSGELDLNNLKELSDSDVINCLTQYKGIGKWTAKMYLIFVLNRMDILPFEDVAFLQSFEWMYKTTDRSKNAIEKKTKKWKPYSSIAARYLYRALDTGLIKQEFHLHKEVYHE